MSRDHSKPGTEQVGKLAYARVTTATVLPLRHRILRPDMPEATAQFPGDSDPATHHFAALTGVPCAMCESEWPIDASPQMCVACLTFMPEAYPSGPRQGEAAWRLRGMAVDTSHQHQGIGAALLDYAIHRLGRLHQAGQGPQPLWCNARNEAIGFYRKQGWTVESDLFQVPTVGPHVVMARRCGN